MTTFARDVHAGNGTTKSGSDRRPTDLLAVPLAGAANPGNTANVTTPGSFALKADIGGPLMFASPDTPGMPKASSKTAWDFLPAGWSVVDLGEVTTDNSDVAFTKQTNPHDTALNTSFGGGKFISPREFAPYIAGNVSRDWLGCVTTSHKHVGAIAAPAQPGSKQGCTNCLGETHEFVEFNLATGRRARVIYPKGFQPRTQLEHARLGIITPQMQRVAQREPHLSPAQVRDEIGAGRMVIPANINHLSHNLDSMCIGRASKTKVNANMGASPISSGTHEEVEKLKWAEKHGADTVMDLSTGGNLDECRAAILQNSCVPIGTVPIYSMIIGKKIEQLDWPTIEASLHHQAKQGVDYFTIHAGVRKAHLKYVKNRLIGIVSRGGSLLAKWMLVHNDENIMYTRWDDICQILREYDVTFSIGDGLRPGGMADATDDAQLSELETLGELTERAWRFGVQVMIEGPGHVPFDQIEYNAKIQRKLCHGAPFYVLGPLVTDMFPGYDHITSCIGATSMAYHGAAMLCYVTPKEHLGLPKKDDVKQGCIAYKIAAHAADVALGIPGTRDRDDELTKARAALNWEKHFELSFDPDTARAYHDEDLDVDTDFCAMCGHDWCSVRISKEIQEFASGKAEGFERMGGADGTKPGAPKKSLPLTPEQQAILEKRGVLSPDEIHKLAAKTKQAINPAATNAESRMPNADTSKLSCHSDYVDAETAQRLQEEKLGKGVLVQLDVRPALGIAKSDRII
ncbi:MAG TPA: phosphomethylpyrimidine synthase [Phycisphaerales bacterium]|nr:phosphomethylpyrimidine synthase [Phycisphaerales bacterium]